MTDPELHARRAVEDTVRTSYGRLVAFLASVGGDLAAAEDALSDATLAALRTWPQRGVPDRPGTWLLTGARRHLVDASRRRAVAARHLPELARHTAGAQSMEPGGALADGADPDSAIPDKRLELMFACTHPVIDAAVRCPLMLQTVLGLDAARIASAFLVAPAAMGQRLVRAKAAIRKAGVPFRVPDADVLAERLTSVLDAVYAAYGAGWDTPAGDAGGADLTAEAVRLARLLAELLPGEPETHGLLALLLHSSARTAARRTADGRFVPLDRQDTALWDRAAVEEAERRLARAFRLGRPGPYQLHAAIQSVHNRRAVTGATDWAAIAALYAGVVASTPTVGAYVARAAAVGHAGDPGSGLRLLDELPGDRVAGYQPYWVARADLLRRLGDDVRAAHATDVAAGLTEDPAVRRFLLSGE